MRPTPVHPHPTKKGLLQNAKMLFGTFQVDLEVPDHLLHVPFLDLGVLLSVCSFWQMVYLFTVPDPSVVLLFLNGITGSAFVEHPEYLA